MGGSSGLTTASQIPQWSTSMLKKPHDPSHRNLLLTNPVLAFTRRTFLARTAISALALSAGATSGRAAEGEPAGNERELIEAAIPQRACAPPRKPRKLLIFDRNVNYGGHASI